jgi:hypothetical protein
MKANTKILLIATGFSFPIFGWIYPSIWDWMALPIEPDIPATRAMVLLFISIVVFFTVAGTMWLFTLGEHNDH